MQNSGRLLAGSGYDDDDNNDDDVGRENE